MGKQIKKKSKEVFETTLSAFRHETGISPFRRDVWYGELKEQRVLVDFQPGDKVRVTVEKIEK